MLVSSTLLCFLLFSPLLCLCSGQSSKWSEEDRVASFKERGYVWPPPQLKPETPGWRRLFERRYQQVAAMENAATKYDAWLLTVGSSIVSHNFTETGWAMTRAPEEAVDLLKTQLHLGLSQATLESAEMCRRMGLRFDEENPPVFIENREMNERILKELLWMHEAWSGQELVPAVAYGLRVYQNNSELFMHVDNPNTHIISSILHIDHSEDSKPWPLVVEDFLGNTNEVSMTSGDMVFYESSKLFHGRPRKFDGSWYSSLFLHYYPKNWDISGAKIDEYHFGIPPTWNNHIPLPEGIEPAEMFGMGMEEPNCPDSWCNNVMAMKYKGPAKAEALTSSNGERELKPREVKENEL